jgi:hypothetical protein
MNLNQIENQALQLHRVRTGLVSFKELYKVIIKNKCMNKNEFNQLLEAARVSPNYNDSITLNNLVIKMGVKNV